MYDHYQWSLYGNCFLSFALNKQPFLRGSIYLIGAHTKSVAKKAASIRSIAVFFKIRDNILKNYLQFRLERTGRMGIYLSFLEKMVCSKSSLVTTLQHDTQGYKKLLRISEFNRSACDWKVQFLLDKSHFSFTLLVF